jgi:hypothetical protein
MLISAAIRADGSESILVKGVLRSTPPILKGVYVREHTDLTWPSDPDFRLQFGAPPGRMRRRDALGSIACQRHLDSRSRRCPDGRARYVYRIDICVLDPPPVPEGAAGGTKLAFLPGLKPLSPTPYSDSK